MHTYPLRRTQTNTKKALPDGRALFASYRRMIEKTSNPFASRRTRGRLPDVVFLSSHPVKNGYSFVMGSSES